MNKYFIFLTIFLSGICSWGCIHFPVSYKDTITEGKKEAFVFHDGKNAHLIIRTNLSAQKLPVEIAWILPFPSLPIKYEEVDGKVFEELYRLSPMPPAGGATIGMSKTGGGIRGLKIHETVIAGNYKIQPIEITKDDSATEFNSWLTENHFNPMPYENQKYYLKKGAVFLAIRMKTTGLEKIEIKPLHVVYPSDKVSVPIKFSHDQRTFDLDVYVFSEVDFNPYTSEAGKVVYSRLGLAFLWGGGFGPYVKTSSNPILGSLLGDRKGFITRFVAHGLNHPDKPLKKIESDPTFLASELRLPK